MEDNRTGMFFVCDDHEFNYNITNKALILTAELLTTESKNTYVEKVVENISWQLYLNAHVNVKKTYLNQGRIKHVGGPGPTWERGPLLHLFLLHKIQHPSSLV